MARQALGFHPDVDHLIEDRLREMESAGAMVVDPVEIPSWGSYQQGECLVLEYEFKNDLNAYLERRGTRFTLGSLIEYNRRHAAEEMPYFEQELFEEANERGPLNDPVYQTTLTSIRRLARAEGIDAVLKKHKLDAIVTATTGPAWLIDWVNGDHEIGGCSTPAAVAGYPHISVPAGLVRGLPVGMSFIGTAWTEPVLIKLAYAFECISHARRPPKLVSTPA